MEVKKTRGPQKKKEWVPQLFYGRLEQILVCELPPGKLWRAFSGQTRLLAVITPCVTGGKDATKDVLSYTQTMKTIITDLQGISAVVGRFETQGKWIIVDRTGGLIKPEFIPAAEMEEDREVDMLQS
jgi:hypothetical protein